MRPPINVTYYKRSEKLGGGCCVRVKLVGNLVNDQDRRQEGEGVEFFCFGHLKWPLKWLT